MRRIFSISLESTVMVQFKLNDPFSVWGPHFFQYNPPRVPEFLSEFEKDLIISVLLLRYLHCIKHIRVLIHNDFREEPFILVGR